MLGDNQKPHAESKRLFVGGLPDDVTKTDLEQRFGKFGSIAAVNVKTKRDSEGKIVNVFAHVDISISEAGFKKCLSTYNDAKWKGRTMKVEVAKEDFLAKLAKERQESQQSPEETKKPTASKRAKEQLEAKTRLEGNMKKAGVEDFTMKKAVPGTAIPGEKDWVVAKFGRVLPIMHMRRQDKKNVTTYDPSKYVHHVRKFKDDSKNNPVTTEHPIEDLTWSLPESLSDKDKKRMGDFPSHSFNKKPKSNHQSNELLHDAERTSVKKSELPEQDFEIVRTKRPVRTGLVKLEAYSRMTEEKEKQNQRKRKSEDVGDLLEQCKLESDEDSCGSADTDEICNSAKKASKAKDGDAESKNDLADSYNGKVRNEAVSGGTETFDRIEEGYSDTIAKGNSDTGLREHTAGKIPSVEASKRIEIVSKNTCANASSKKEKFDKGGKTTWIDEDTSEDDNENVEDLNKSQQIQNKDKNFTDTEKESEKFAKKDNRQEFATAKTCAEDNRKKMNKDQIKVLKSRTGKNTKCAKDIHDRSSDSEIDDSDRSYEGGIDHVMELESENEFSRNGNTEDSSSENADSSVSNSDSDVSEELEHRTKALQVDKTYSVRTPMQSNISEADSVEKQGKQMLSDKVRLESMKRRQEGILTQKAVIQKALQVVDSTRGSSTGTSHVRFDSDGSESSDAESTTQYENGPSKAEAPKRKLQGLFDSDDDEDNDMETDKKADEDRFRIKPQFQGKAGEKLLRLQHRIGMDSRFKLGASFMEKEEEKEDKSTDAVDEDQQLKAEKQKSLTVLQGIVGSQAMNSLKSKTTANFRDPSRMRYDPTREDHAQFEMNDTRNADTSPSKRKTRAKDEATLPKVSKDTYYEVSNLDFGQERDDNKPFSFFGEAEPEEDDKNADEKGFSSLEQDILASTALGKRQLTLDSSGESESEDEEAKHDGKDEEAKHNGKGNVDKSHMDTSGSNHQSSSVRPFFFKPDDIRLKTGPQQFRRKLSIEGMNKWFEKQKAELQMEYKKRHRKALQDSKKAVQQASKKPRR